MNKKNGEECQYSCFSTIKSLYQCALCVSLHGIEINLKKKCYYKTIFAARRVVHSKCLKLKIFETNSLIGAFIAFLVTLPIPLVDKYSIYRYHVRGITCTSIKVKDFWAMTIVNMKLMNTVLKKLKEPNLIAQKRYK